MTSYANALDLTPIPGTGWMLARYPGTGSACLTVALPEGAPADLVDATRMRLIAGLSGQCPGCGAVADPTRPAKQHPVRGTEATLTSSDEIPHDPACPASTANVGALERMARGGIDPEADVSPETLFRVHDFLVDHGAINPDLPITPTD